MKKQLELHGLDILTHPEFLKLKDQEHHYTSTVYDHSIRVAEAASRMCRFFHVNHEKSRDTIRAALLHDFYDFDRKERFEHRQSTSMPRIERMKTCFLIVHPRSAAKHADEVFGLSERQIKAIKSHMFPLAPLPTSVDGWIITASDKFVACKEGIEALRKKDIFSWNEK